MTQRLNWRNFWGLAFQPPLGYVIPVFTWKHEWWCFLSREAATPLLGVSIVGKTSRAHGFITKDMLKTTPYPSPYLVPDPYIPMSTKHLTWMTKEQLQQNMGKTELFLSSLPLLLLPLWFLAQGTTICTIHTVSRNVGILCDPLLPLTYYVPLPASSYNVTLLISLQSRCHFPSSGYQDVWPGLWYPFPNLAPCLQPCPTPVQLMHIWQSDLSIVKFA